MAYNDKTRANGVQVAESVYSDIDLLFKPHPVTGDISLKYDTDAIKRSIKNLMLTNYYERPFKPGFGSNLRAKLFELNHPRYYTKFTEDIQKIIASYEPRVSNVEVNFDNGLDTNQLNVRISYVIRNVNQDRQRLTVTLDRIR